MNVYNVDDVCCCGYSSFILRFAVIMRWDCEKNVYALKSKRITFTKIFEHQKNKLGTIDKWCHTNLGFECIFFRLLYV